MYSALTREEGSSRHQDYFLHRVSRATWGGDDDLDKTFQRGVNRIASTFHQILSGPITLEKGTVLLGSNMGVSQKHNANFSRS